MAPFFTAIGIPRGAGSRADTSRGEGADQVVSIFCQALFVLVFRSRIGPGAVRERPFLLLDGFANVVPSEWRLVAKSAKVIYWTSSLLLGPLRLVWKACIIRGTRFVIATFRAQRFRITSHQVTEGGKAI